MVALRPATDEQAVPSQTPSQTSGAERVLIGTFVCLILMVFAAAASAIWEGRRSAIHEFQDREVRLGLILAEQAQRAFQAADMVVAATVNQIETGGIETDDDLRRQMAGKDVHAEL